MGGAPESIMVKRSQGFLGRVCDAQQKVAGRGSVNPDTVNDCD